MRKYGTIAPTFWTQGTGKRLRQHPNAQRLALYLMSAPTANMIGLYHIAPPTVAHEVGMTVEEAEGALEVLGSPFEGESHPFLVWDPDSEMVFVRTMARRQLGLDEGERLKPKDKRIQNIEKLLRECTNPLLLQAFWAEYHDALHLPEPWWSQGASKGHRSPFEGATESIPQGQGQGQEQRSYGTGETDPVPPSRPSAEASPEARPLALVPDKPRPRRQRATQGELRPKAPIGLAWKTWREMYQTSRRRYGKYVESGDCKGVMLKVAELAMGEAISELQSRGTPGDPVDPMVQAVLEHWFASYLRDDGRDGFLAENRHAVRFILKSLTAYGTPWSRDAAADPSKAQAEYLRHRSAFGGNGS